MARTPDDQNSKEPAIATDAGSSQLRFQRAYSGDRCLLRVVGEIKRSNADQLTSEVIKIFSEVSDVTLDFREVGYCDTTGLESLVRIYKHVDRHPGLVLTLFVPAGALLNSLLSCRFDKLMNITHDESVLVGDWQPA